MLPLPEFPVRERKTLLLLLFLSPGVGESTGGDDTPLSGEFGNGGSSVLEELPNASDLKNAELLEPRLDLDLPSDAWFSDGHSMGDFTASIW